MSVEEGKNNLGKLRCSNIFWTVFPHVSLILSLVCYAALGALLFRHLEGKRVPDGDYDGYLDELWDLFNNTKCNDIYFYSCNYLFVCSVILLLTTFCFLKGANVFLLLFNK